MAKTPSLLPHRAPVPKVQLSLRLDADVIEYYRGLGKGWMTRLNLDLVEVVEVRRAHDESLRRRRAEIRGAK